MTRELRSKPFPVVNVSSIKLGGANFPRVTTHQEAFFQGVQADGGEVAMFTVKPQAGAEPDWRLDLKKLGGWLKSLSKPVAVIY